MPFYNEIYDNTDFSISFFHRTPKNEFEAFGEGYRIAANSLAKELVKKGEFRHYEAYPIVFLYRHALELNLKNIIYQVSELLSCQGIESINNELYNNHNLVHLSEKVNRLLKRAFPKDEEMHQFLKKVVQVAKEFDEIDPGSYSYRYPINTKGELSTKPNQTVNLNSLTSCMDDLLEKLEAINYGLDMQIDIAQDAYEILENF